MKRIIFFACLAGLAPLTVARGQQQVGGDRPAVEAPGAAQAAPAMAGRPADAAWDSSASPAASAPCQDKGGRKGRGRGDCWTRLKGWLCFHQDTPNDPTCFRPTLYRPPLYNWFPCNEGCGSGCGGSCGGGGYAGLPGAAPAAPLPPAAPMTMPPAAGPAAPPVAPPPRVELRAPSFGDPQAYSYPLPTPGSRLMPSGFRFAGPESPGLAGRRATNASAVGPDAAANRTQ